MDRTKNRPNPEHERIKRLMDALVERQMMGDGPKIMLRISGGVAKVVVLRDEDATVHDLDAAREKKRDLNRGKPPVSD